MIDTCILRGVNFLQRQASYCGNLGMTHKYEKSLISVLCILGWVDFLQKHASYCGNLGMTHKDEKWQK